MEHHVEKEHLETGRLQPEMVGLDGISFTKETLTSTEIDQRIKKLGIVEGVIIGFLTGTLSSFIIWYLTK